MADERRRLLPAASARRKRRAKPGKDPPRREATPNPSRRAGGENGETLSNMDSALRALARSVGPEDLFAVYELILN